MSAWLDANADGIALALVIALAGLAGLLVAIVIEVLRARWIR